jgi:hypothetical protein
MLHEKFNLLNKIGNLIFNLTNRNHVNIKSN